MSAEASPRECRCWARKHALVGSCAACGRVVCQKEGEGPCPFCGNAVYAGRAQRESAEAGLAAAEQLKQRLLRNDRDDLRKGIIDEEVDWHELERDVWLDAESRREAARRGLAQSLADRQRAETVLLSFDEKGNLGATLDAPDHAGRREEARAFLNARGPPVAAATHKFDDERLAAVLQGLEAHYPSARERVPPKPAQQPEPAEEEDEAGPQPRFDAELFPLEQWADFRCLSVGAVRAQLIVNGFRRFENFPSALKFRGPLFIHANESAETDLAQLQAFYTGILPDFSLPPSGPSNCIVGVVDLQDVWPQTKHRENVPASFHAETNAPFTLVLRNPRRLAVPLRWNAPGLLFELSLRAVAPCLPRLTRAVLPALPPLAQPFESDLLANEGYLRFQRVIGCVEELHSTEDIVEFKMLGAPLEKALIRADKDFGKALRNGYDARKRLNVRAYPELGFPLWYFARRVGEPLSAERLAVDVFRLARPGPLAFQRSYLFFLSVGAELRLESAAEPVVEFTLSADKLVAVTNFALAEWKATLGPLSSQPLEGTGDHLAVVFAIYGA